LFQTKNPEEEDLKNKTPPGGGVSFDQSDGSACATSDWAEGVISVSMISRSSLITTARVTMEKKKISFKKHIHSSSGSQGADQCTATHCNTLQHSTAHLQTGGVSGEADPCAPRSHCLRPGESTNFLIGHFPGGG